VYEWETCSQLAVRSVLSMRPTVHSMRPRPIQNKYQNITMYTNWPPKITFFSDGERHIILTLIQSCTYKSASQEFSGLLS